LNKQLKKGIIWGKEKEGSALKLGQLKTVELRCKNLCFLLSFPKIKESLNDC